MYCCYTIPFSFSFLPSRSFFLSIFFFSLSSSLIFSLFISKFLFLSFKPCLSLRNHVLYLLVYKFCLCVHVFFQFLSQVQPVSTSLFRLFHISVCMSATFSSILILFYYLAPQQNDSIVMSRCMQFTFGDKREMKG